MGDDIFETKVSNVAVERFFYKLRRIGYPEIKFISNLIDGTPEFLRETNIAWLELFVRPFMLYDAAHNVINDDVISSFDKILCNLEEDLHCLIESNGGDILALLHNEDVSFYDDSTDRTIAFLFFLCEQYLRTKKMKEKAISSVGNFNGLNMDAMWPVLRHVYATNIAATIFSDRKSYKPIIIKNSSATPFITADQPIINTKGPDDLEFYYPLSPNLALLLSRDASAARTIDPLDESYVVMRNMSIVNMSDTQVFASSRDVLEVIREKRHAL